MIFEVPRQRLLAKHFNLLLKAAMGSERAIVWKEKNFRFRTLLMSEISESSEFDF